MASDFSKLADAVTTAGKKAAATMASGGSSGTTTSTPGTTTNGAYTPIGTYNDADLKTMGGTAYSPIEQYKNAYNQAAASGDSAGMQSAHQAAEDYRAQYGYSGGTDGSQNINSGGNTASLIADYASAGKDYENKMNEAAGYAQQANNAAVQQAVNDLEAQKKALGAAQLKANGAAQEAYNTVINPNGGLAESLAARGLLPSGLTESSLIDAGNTYQSALNETQNEVLTQLSAIQQAIVNAKLSGDISSAQILADYAADIAANAQTNNQNILQARQWALENYQGQKQQNYNNTITTEQQEDAHKQAQQDLLSSQQAYTQADQSWPYQLEAYRLAAVS